jgi:AcrR family transcriptional regulator
MPPKVKSEAEKQKASALILDAARELFVTKGIEAVTMREIAKKIGYSPTTIYLYFKDKETLIHEICVKDFEQLGGQLSGLMQIEEPVERMINMGDSYARFALNYPNHYRMIFMTRWSECPLGDDIDPGKDGYQLLMQVVEAVYEAGHFLPEHDNPELIAQTIWAGIHGVCSLQINMGHDPHINWTDIEDRIALMLATLTRGLLKYPNYKRKLK